MRNLRRWYGRSGRPDRGKIVLSKTGSSQDAQEKVKRRNVIGIVFSLYGRGGGLLIHTIKTLLNLDGPKISLKMGGGVWEYFKIPEIPHFPHGGSFCPTWNGLPLGTGLSFLLPTGSASLPRAASLRGLSIRSSEGMSGELLQELRIIRILVVGFFWWWSW